MNRNGGHDITEVDITIDKCFTHFLHDFYDETCTLSAIYTPTSYLTIHSVTKIAEHLHDETCWHGGGNVKICFRSYPRWPETYIFDLGFNGVATLAIEGKV